MQLEAAFLKDGDELLRVIRNAGVETISRIKSATHVDPPRLAWDTAELLGHEPVMVTKPLGNVRIVDVFCGAGGLSLGAKRAANALGYTTSFDIATDRDSDAIAVYARNLSPTQISKSDIGMAVDFQICGEGNQAQLRYAPEVIEPEYALRQGNVDLLLAGPPCQGHSNLNNHTRRDDPRNDLYISTVALAIALKAKSLVVENVPEVMVSKEQVVQSAVSILEKSGYTVELCTINAIKLGVAQTRRRSFLIARQAGKPNVKDVLSVFQTEKRDLRWAIGDLEQQQPTNPFDSPSQQNSENQARIQYLIENDLHNLPDKNRPVCHQEGHTYGSVYGRLQWDQPAGTITQGFMVMGRGRFVHPTNPRTLTPHEAARIQAIPDSFIFRSRTGEDLPRKSFAKLIGNAVPPPLGFVSCLAALH